MMGAENGLDRSIARQLACDSVSEWFGLMAGTVPLVAAAAMDRTVRATGRPFREVLLDALEFEALIMVNDKDRIAARDALFAAGRKPTW